MAKPKRSSKNSDRLSRFDPKARKKVTDSELKALEKSKNANFYFLKGEKHRIGGELKKATSCYKKALDADPEHEDSLFFMGYCCLLRIKEDTDANLETNKASKAKEAALALEKLIAVREKKSSILWDDYIVYDCLGRAQFALDLYEKGIKSFRRAIELNSHSTASYISLTFGLCKQGLWQEAIQPFKQAIRIDPSDAERYFQLGILYHITEHYAEAIMSYKKAIRIKPDFAEAYFYLGVRYGNSGHHKKAIQAFKQVIKMIPGHAEALYNLGYACKHLGRFEEAIQALKQTIKIKPDVEEPHLLLGIAYRASARYDEAIQAIQRAIEIKPDSADAHYHLARAYAGSADWAKVVQYVNKAIKLRTRDERFMVFLAYAVRMRGCAHFGISKYSHAKSDFHQAIRLFRKVHHGDGVDNFGIQLRGLYYLASSFHSQTNNRYEKAKADIESALGFFKKSKARPLVLFTEFVSETLDIDLRIMKLANAKDVESLKRSAEETLTKTEGCKRILRTMRGATANEFPPALLAKHGILRLLVDVLNGKSLDEEVLIDASETLEGFLDDEWGRRFERIGILLRKLAKYKNFEEMKKAEHDILGLTPDLSVINGYITGQVLKHTLWPLEVTKLLKQQIGQTEELRSELIGFKQQLIDDLKPKTKPSKITFTDTSVLVDGKDLGKGAPLLLAEYIILKQKEVHWLWAYIILPKFAVKKYTPDQQFRNYISKIRKELEKCGMRLAILKHEEEGFAIYEGMDDRVISNIRDARKTYEEALSVRESNLKEAVKVLSSITKEDNNRWYSFTDAYMMLSRWMCELEFEEVSDSVREKCIKFFKWYLKRLRLGISKINRYGVEEGLGDDSLAAFEEIKSEFREATDLYSALIHKRPLDKEEQCYESFVNVLLHAHENLISVRKRSPDSEGQQNDSIKVIKFLAKENKDMADVVKYGRDTLDQLLESKGQRHKCSEEAIHDMHEDIYWEIASVILEIKNFDKFERKRANKLRHLKNHLFFCLRHKLAKYD